MLIEKRADILAAKERLPNATLRIAADLITQHVARSPNNWPEDDEEAIALVCQAVIGAKVQRLGRELSEVECENLLKKHMKHLEDTLTIGLSGALWQYKCAGNIRKGAKWAGKAALVGLGAALGIGLG